MTIRFECTVVDFTTIKRSLARRLEVANVYEALFQRYETVREIHGISFDGPDQYMLMGYSIDLES